MKKLAEYKKEELEIAHVILDKNLSASKETIVQVSMICEKVVNNDDLNVLLRDSENRATIMAYLLTIIEFMDRTKLELLQKNINDKN